MKAAPSEAGGIGVQERIEELIRGPQYAMRQAEKDLLLAALLAEVCRDMAERCPPYGRFLETWGSAPAAWQSPADVPPLPVAIFKRLLLSAVPPENVVRELHSSGTTGQQPSRIVLDKTTAFRQGRALVAVLKEHIGPGRRPLLVLDAAESTAAGGSLSASGAAIRGLAPFASPTVFGMQAGEGGAEPDWSTIEQFFARHGAGPLLVFGFTYVVWSRFLAAAEGRACRFRAPGTTLLHSGGWKKLAEQAVTKEALTARAAAVLGCPATQVLDMYGMVEQVGTVFVDCEAGHKHAPAFADVILRRADTLQPVGPGERGIIEVLSLLPSSYPGQAILTEDEGLLVGVDDCPCGRKGKFFRFGRRIERAEPRGCGDVRALVAEAAR